MSLTSIPREGTHCQSTLLYYVVIQCSSCKHNYFYPARKLVQMDHLTCSFINESIDNVASQIQSPCTHCQHMNRQDSAKRAVLSVGLPDKTGAILCDFSFRNGQVVRKFFRMEKDVEPVQFFKENKDYFRSAPPNDSLGVLLDEDILEEFQRVLNPRETWKMLLRKAVLEGCAFSKVSEGCFFFVTNSTEPSIVESQMKEVATDEFWQLFEEKSFVKRRLQGVDLWKEEQQKKVGLLHSSYRHWLPEDLIEKLDNKELQARTFLIEGFAFDLFLNKVDKLGLQVSEVTPPKQTEKEYWIQNEEGFSRQFPSFELVELLALYKGRCLADEITCLLDFIQDQLEQDQKVFESINEYLPPNYKAELEALGWIKIYRGETPIQKAPLAQITNTLDTKDSMKMTSLISWLISGGKVESPRILRKHLISQTKLNELSAIHREDFPYLLARKKGEQGLFEIITEESLPYSTDKEEERMVHWGVKRFHNQFEEANQQVHLDLDKNHYVLRYFVKKNFFRMPQYVVFLGEDVETIALQSGLIRGLLQACKIKLGISVRVYLPFNGILLVSKTDMTEEKLEAETYDFARRVSDIGLKSDRLGYEHVLELSDESVGKFELISIE